MKILEGEIFDPLGFAVFGQAATGEDEIRFFCGTQIVGAITDIDHQIELIALGKQMSPFAIANLAATVSSQMGQFHRQAAAVEDGSITVDRQITETLTFEDGLNHEVQRFADDHDLVIMSSAPANERFESRPQLELASAELDHLFASASQHRKLLKDTIFEGDLSLLQLTIQLAPVTLSKTVEQAIRSDLLSGCAIEVHKDDQALGMV